MRRLTLLRHAKSSWTETGIRDFDRPLNDRGRRAAAVMGGFMAREGLAFDAVLASPAVRIRETLAVVEQALGCSLEPRFEAAVYMASAATLLELVAALPDNPAHVLLVGHNPGLEDLALWLAAEDDPLRAEIFEKYPTASLAELGIPARFWADAAEGSATIARFTRPRDLDPSLGPED